MRLTNASWSRRSSHHVTRSVCPAERLGAAVAAPVHRDHGGTGMTGLAVALDGQASLTVAEVEAGDRAARVVEQLDLRLDPRQQGKEQQPGQCLSRRLRAAVGPVDGPAEQRCAWAPGWRSEVLRPDEVPVQGGVQRADQRLRRQEARAVAQRPSGCRHPQAAAQLDQLVTGQRCPVRHEAAACVLLPREVAVDGDVVEALVVGVGRRVLVVDERQLPDAGSRTAGGHRAEATPRTAVHRAACGEHRGPRPLLVVEDVTTIRVHASPGRLPGPRADERVVLAGGQEGQCLTTGPDAAGRRAECHETAHPAHGCGRDRVRPPARRRLWTVAGPFRG
jgi:hypothetical protein